MTIQTKVRTCLWFNSQGEEAAEFYVSLLPDSRVDNVVRQTPEAPAFMIEFTLAGAPYQIMNGGPMFELNEAASIAVLTEDQAETDKLWAALIADGGKESRCGWLVDKYGLSWQIVPQALPRLLHDKDREAAGRAMNAMMSMGKIDIAALEAAFKA